MEENEFLNKVIEFFVDYDFFKLFKYVDFKQVFRCGDAMSV